MSHCDYLYVEPDENESKPTLKKRMTSTSYIYPQVPYRNVDSSAIIWGVGSNSLQLPIPSTCPDGFKLLVKQCWAPKPRNRPSFKHILMHLDIAAVEILSFSPSDYFKTQVGLLTQIYTMLLSSMKMQEIGLSMQGKN